MPAGPQSGVDEDGALAVGMLPGERGCQQLHTAVEQDRDVPWRRSPGSASQCL